MVSLGRQDPDRGSDTAAVNQAVPAPLCAQNCFVAVKQVENSHGARADLLQEANFLARVCHCPMRMQMGKCGTHVALTGLNPTCFALVLKVDQEYKWGNIKWQPSKRLELTHALFQCLKGKAPKKQHFWLQRLLEGTMTVKDKEQKWQKAVEEDPKRKTEAAKTTGNHLQLATRSISCYCPSCNNGTVTTTCSNKEYVEQRLPAQMQLTACTDAADNISTSPVKKESKGLIRS
ncbi:Hypp9645, partial [Branchiostoma lanceolatum]